ncbi:unnamed protein product, partial [Adineta steineri]
FEKPQTVGNNMFKNDGSFLEQFQKSQGQSSVTSQNTDIRQSSSYGNEYPSMNSSQQFAPPWFPPNPQSSSIFDQNSPLPFPMPPPELLSKMFQGPPPPLPIPTPVNNSSTTTVN